MSNDSPFVPGARVAIARRFNNGYYEGFVDKVHKTGNFTLRGSKQQWKPYREHNTNIWRAIATGDKFYRSSLMIWNAETNAEISEKIAEFERIKRFRAVKDTLEFMKENDITEELVSKLEAALPKMEK